MTDTPIVIIGAGLAGLGAAALCRDHGRRAVVLEASGRVGGRAWTDHPAALGELARARRAWEQGNGVADIRAPDMDAVLHRERLDARKKKRLHALPMPLQQLPDGTMVQAGTESYLIAQGRVLLWSPGGYRAVHNELTDALLLTPPSTLRALGAGYRPVLHESAVEWLAAAAKPTSS